MKKFKKTTSQFLKEKGFTLVEIMAAVGMMGMISVAVMKMMDQANRTQKSVGQLSTIIDLTNTARRALQNPEACRETFTANAGTLSLGNVAGNPTFNTIRGGSERAGANRHDYIVADGTTRYGSGADTVVVTNIVVENYIAGLQNNSMLGGDGIQYGTVDVRITYQKGSSTNTAAKHSTTSYGRFTVDRVIEGVNVAFQVRDTNGGTAGNIVTCDSPTEDALLEFCLALGGEPDPADGQKCVNIKVQNTALSAVDGNNTRNYAIITRGSTVGDQGGSIKAEGSLVVGGTGSANIYGDDENGPAEQGSAYFQNFVYVGENPTNGVMVGNVTGNGGDSGTLRVMDDLVVGRAATGSIYTYNDVNVTNDTMLGAWGLTGYFHSDASDGDVTIGDVATAWTNADSVLRVQGGEGQFVNDGLADPVQVVVNNNLGGISYAGISTLVNNNRRVEFVENNTTNISTYHPAVTGQRISILGGDVGIMLYDHNDPVDQNDLRFGHNLSGGEYTLTESPGASGFIFLNSNERFRQYSGAGANYIFGPGGGPSHTDDPRLILGFGNESMAYRPSYIYNMPSVATSADPWGNPADWNYGGYEIPNKHWVFEAITNILSDGTDFINIEGEVLYSQLAEPMEALRKDLCRNTRYDKDPGAPVDYQYGAWTSGLPVPPAGEGQTCDLGSGGGGLGCGETLPDTCVGHFAANYIINSSMIVGDDATFNGPVIFNQHITFSLDVTVANGYGVIMASDRNFKANISPIDNVLAKLDKIRGVEFDWKKNGKKEIGFIAQEIKEVFPELVQHDRVRDNYYVAYPQMTAVAIQAAKELKEENKKIERSIGSIKEALCELNPSRNECQ